MQSNYYVLAKENFKIAVIKTIFPTFIILVLIPFVFGTSNLNSTKAAECLEKMVGLIGIPIFVPILKPEQNSAIHEVIFIKEFPYRVIVIFRLIMATILTVLSIYFFELYMLNDGCIFPIYKYLYRAIMVTMMIGGCGLCASAITGSTLAGYLIAFVYYFILQWNILGGVMSIVAKGVSVLHLIILFVLYFVIVLICGKSCN
ncbi:hypothetical protein IMSAGC011_02702 [Lachnospiraceae bacterium]|nr:hypothetical protein IMSAGC011_02702 [Lachnospiraceae bacterium]